MQKAKETPAEFIRSLIVAIFLAILFRSFLYEPYRIPSGSMEPTLLIGDNLFVSKFAYGFSRYSLPFGINLISGRIGQFNKPAKGDIIVFKNPKNTSINYIKRLVGLPGDVIEVVDGVLHINNKPVKLTEDGYFIDSNQTKAKKLIENIDNKISYNILDSNPFNEFDNTKKYLVPANHYFFMGDNRDNSRDSRDSRGMSFIHQDLLVGRAEFIFFSSNSELWKFWRWFVDFNYSRFFTSLRTKS